MSAEHRFDKTTGGLAGRLQSEVPFGDLGFAGRLILFSVELVL